MMCGEVLRSDGFLLDMHKFSVFIEDVTGENVHLNRGEKTAMLSNSYLNWGLLQLPELEQQRTIDG